MPKYYIKDGVEEVVIDAPEPEEDEKKMKIILDIADMYGIMKT